MGVSTRPSPRKDDPGVDVGGYLVVGGFALLSPHHLSRISWILL